MTEYQIQSKNFLPDSIRDYDFYSRLTEIVDYILDKYHTQNIDVLKALYDIKNSNFDYEKILELLGSTEFIEYDVGSEQFKTLCVLLSNLYEIKGTKRGLQYLLRLLDIECEVYEWYDINKWYQQGDPRWTQPAEPCSIVLQLGLEHRPIGVCDRYNKWALPRTGSPAEEMLGENQAFEDTEGKFRDFATRLLWICTSLTEIRWAKILTDYVDVTSTLAWESTEIFYDKYSPFVYNCPNTIQVGFPFYQEFPYVGDNVKVGDFEYKQYSFLVRSFRDYNDPINYDGWTNTGIVGYSQTVASGDMPLVGDPDLVIGQIFYWNYEGVYTYPGWYYVGQILIEGNISAGCPIVSGCQVSIIHTHTETAFENDFLTHRGIIVGYEDFVQPPDNIGDGHIVDTQPGDILLAEEESTFVENPIPVEITDLTTHKETAYASHISDLYEPFLVGDPTKFVGDTNLRVGQDYFFTWFEASKEIDFSEQFHTTCLQVGSWGHAYFPESTYYLVVGQPNLAIGETYFVGENINPAKYEDRNPLLYVGTSLLVGSENIVTPTIRVGQGFNYVGELATWDASDFVTYPKNIIYEWLEAEISPEIIEEEIPVFEQLETGLAEYELSSNIRESLWNKLVGASPVVGREEYFSVGNIYPVGYGFVGEYLVGETEQQQFVGNSPYIGYSEYVGSDFIAEDPYCKLAVDKEITLGGERFVYETPVVGDARIHVGYTGFIPIYIGHSEYKYYSVGDSILVGYSVAVGAGYEDITGTPHLVGDPITVGQQEFISTVDTYVNVSATGEIYNGTQINVSSLFDTEHEFTLLEDIIPKVDSFTESLEITGFVDKVFQEKIGDIYASNTYLVSATDTVGTILVSPILFVGDSTDGIHVNPVYIVGQADYNVKADDISILTTEIETSDLQDNIYFNYPRVEIPEQNYIVVGDESIIGAGTTVPFTAGDPELFVNEEEAVGGFKFIPGTPSYVGIPNYGNEVVLSKLFVGSNAKVGETSFSTETIDISKSVIANSRLVAYIDEGEAVDILFEDNLNTAYLLDVNKEFNFPEEQFNPNFIPESDFILAEDGSILSHPADNGTFPIFIATESGNLFVGYLETNPDNAINSYLSATVEYSTSEQFNINQDPVPVVMGSEDNTVLIFSPTTDEVNPVYLVAEQTEPYSFDPYFNPTNAIHSVLTYLIDET